MKELKNLNLKINKTLFFVQTGSSLLAFLFAGIRDSDYSGVNFTKLFLYDKLAKKLDCFTNTTTKSLSNVKWSSFLKVVLVKICCVGSDSRIASTWKQRKASSIQSIATSYSKFKNRKLLRREKKQVTSTT